MDPVRQSVEAGVRAAESLRRDGGGGPAHQAAEGFGISVGTCGVCIFGGVRDRAYKAAGRRRHRGRACGDGRVLEDICRGALSDGRDWGCGDWGCVRGGSVDDIDVREGGF